MGVAAIFAISLKHCERKLALLTIFTNRKLHIRAAYSYRNQRSTLHALELRTITYHCTKHASFGMQ